jgi:YD repeat-containing protein
LARAADPAGVISELGYDVRGRLATTVTGAHQMSFGYDTAGWVDRFTDPLGATTRVVNDPTGQLAELHRPDGSGLRFTNGAHAGPDAVTSLAGEVLARFGYDSHGRITRADTATQLTHVERDGHGRVATVETSRGQTRYVRDADGYLASRRDPDGGVTEWRRADDGTVTAILAPDGSLVAPPDRAGDRTRDRVQRDDAGRVTTDEAGRTYRYDLAGRLAETVTADGFRTTYTYNDLGLLATEAGPSGVRRRYVYGDGGELRQRVDSDGGTVSYDHDAVGRRIGETASDGSSVRYRWDDLRPALPPVPRMMAYGTLQAMFGRRM